MVRNTANLYVGRDNHKELKGPSQASLVKFGKNVRERRLEVGISQEELAFNCDLDRSYVGGVERGERNISVLNIIKIAKALKTTASELMLGVK